MSQSKIVGFISHKLTLRGTEIAMYDYADFNESLLGNKSIIITKDYEKIKNEYDVHIDAYKKFQNRFTVLYYETQNDVDEIVSKYNISHLYIIKISESDFLISTKCKNLIHKVFHSLNYHGDVYAVVSNYVNNRCNTNYPVVPHMIRVFDTQENLKNELNIPENAIVFGCYGGSSSFNEY